MKLIAEPVMPRLSADEYEALKGSIRAWGVRVHVLVAPDRPVTEGEEPPVAYIIDGHERVRACEDLGITPPIRVLEPLSPEQRRELAIRLNAERRHLTKEERDGLLERYIKAAPHKSTREIADACMVSQSTAARAKARLIAAETIESVPTVGLNGKVYRNPPKGGPENPKVADQGDHGGRPLPTVGDAQPATGGVEQGDAETATVGVAEPPAPPTTPTPNELLARVVRTLEEVGQMGNVGDDSVPLLDSAYELIRGLREAAVRRDVA